MLRTYKLLSQVGRPFSTKARSQLTESVDILYKASRERLSAEKDPLTLGKYSENHSAYLLSQAEEVQEAHFTKHQLERPQEQLQASSIINSGAEVFGKTVTLEDISG